MYVVQQTGRYMCAGKQTGRQVCMYAGQQTGRQVCIVCRSASRQTGQQTDGQVGMQRGS